MIKVLFIRTNLFDRLLKSWRKRRRQQIRMRHETTRFIDYDELANRYPHLERKKPEEDNFRISGSKNLSLLLEKLVVILPIELI